MLYFCSFLTTPLSASLVLLDLISPAAHEFSSLGANLTLCRVVQLILVDYPLSLRLHLDRIYDVALIFRETRLQNDEPRTPGQNPVSLGNPVTTTSPHCFSISVYLPALRPPHCCARPPLFGPQHALHHINITRAISFLSTRVRGERGKVDSLNCR
jgi:hypothetical protein